MLGFRPWDELDSTETDQVAGLIDVADAAADADVYVDSRYGTFDADDRHGREPRLSVTLDARRRATP